MLDVKLVDCSGKKEGIINELEINSKNKTSETCRGTSITLRRITSLELI
jgi:hypothetical protein